MADGVETREQRRRRRLGLGLDPDGESDEDPVDPGHGNPGDGDGGNPGDGHGGGGPGGPGESDSGEGSDPGDDETARAIKKQTKSLLILAKSIKDLVSKKEDGEYYVDTTTGIKKVKKRISPPPLSSKETKERDQKHICSEQRIGLIHLEYPGTKIRYITLNILLIQKPENGMLI